MADLLILWSQCYGDQKWALIVCIRMRTKNCVWNEIRVMTVR